MKNFNDTFEETKNALQEAAKKIGEGVWNADNFIWKLTPEQMKNLDYFWTKFGHKTPVDCAVAILNDEIEN
jgi:hypothetical protein